MRTSLFDSGTVAHTAPSPSTATPNGPTPPSPAPVGEATACRLNTPSFSRVTLTVVGSANQTAPSGATARRPSLATGVARSNEVMDPSLDIREIARMRESVYHAEPSASAASPSGSRFSLPLASFSILPSFNRPMASEELDGEPHHPVTRDCDADRDVRPGGHPILDEFGIGPRTQMSDQRQCCSKKHDGSRPRRARAAAAGAIDRSPGEPSPRMVNACSRWPAGAGEVGPVPSGIR